MEPLPAYAGFVAAEPEAGDDVVSVELVEGDAEPPPGARATFECESWSAYALAHGDRAIALAPAAAAGGETWCARFDCAVTRVRVTCAPPLVHQGALPNLIRYPLDQLLLMHRLAGEGGAVIHCLVAAVGDRAVICPGVSGAGKTTLARQLAGCADIHVLSDDRAVVRRDADGYRAYGTPWPGEGGYATNRGLPLAAIGFLEQTPAAAIASVHLAEALKRMARVASVPWFDRELGPQVFDGLAALCTRVPAFTLAFAPDASAAEAVRALAGAQPRTPKSGSAA